MFAKQEYSHLFNSSSIPVKLFYLFVKTVTNVILFNTVR